MSPRHNSGDDGRCMKCGEVYPCFVVRGTQDIVKATQELAARGGTRQDLKRLLEEKLPR